MSRLGPLIFALGATCLAILMVYTLVLDFGVIGQGRSSEGSGTSSVAVFYPERVYWLEFRQGIRICAEKGLLRVLKEEESSVLVESSRSKRQIRFDLHDHRGVVEMNDELETLLGHPPQPIAIVGSSNTVLTQSIATALRKGSEKAEASGPLLLIPWASTVLTEPKEPSDAPIGLLDLYPGRTFRYCPNNQAQAGLLVGCLLSCETPLAVSKAIIVEDRQDPYSTDLGESFHRAIERAAPKVEIDERSVGINAYELVISQAFSATADERLADEIWNEAAKLPPNNSVWVVLPLQEEPTIRMIDALRRQSRTGSQRPSGVLKVLTGDSIGLDVFQTLAGRCSFPVFSVSSNSLPKSSKSASSRFSPDSQIPAEIVSSLILALDKAGDRPLTADTLRLELDGVTWKAEDPRAVGRSLSFSQSGERNSETLGHILTIEPGDSRVLALPRKQDGAWGKAVPLSPSPISFQP